jgi:hypothetical protein
MDAMNACAIWNSFVPIGECLQTLFDPEGAAYKSPGLRPGLSDLGSFGAGTSLNKGGLTKFPGVRQWFQK